MTFYGKQREVLTCFLENRLSRLNLLVGAVRSGKTFIALIVWALWVGTSPPGGAYLMCAKSLTTLKRNSLDLLTQLVGGRNFSYSLAAKQGELFGRRVYLEGCNDARAESHIRGLTLQGAYCDELTLFPEDFFAMLLSRLSEPGAKLFATTNPDNPRHWLKVRYMDRAAGLDMRVTEFSIDDNAALDPAYVENLKREYTGVFYKRFILGLWVVADGLCYPQFAHAPDGWLCDRIPEPENVQFLTVGVDFGGNRSLTTFVAAAVHRGFSKIGFIADHHIEGQKGEIDGNRVNAEFLRFIRALQAAYPQIPVRFVYADSEAQYLINSLRAACRAAGYGFPIGDSAKRPIVERIVCLNTLMNQKRAYVLRACRLVAGGLRSAAWDTAAAERGLDVRLDNFSSDIDILDAMEYSFEHFIPRLLPGR